jgi:Fe-S-cluster containining protein
MKEKAIDIFTPQGYEGDDRPKKMRFKKKSSCDRCGNCCSTSSPSLMKEDIGLFISGLLSDENTYTIREGEIIRSNDGNLYESFMELIKIREKENSTTCIFYNKGCTIYDSRPVQCREFNCWETHQIKEGIEKIALKRADLFNQVDFIMEAIKRHDEKCSYKRLSDTLERLKNGIEEAVEDIIDMLQYDINLRELLMKKFNLKPHSMDLILGRALSDRLIEFGLKVVKDDEGYILQSIEEAKK